MTPHTAERRLVLVAEQSIAGNVNPAETRGALLGRYRSLDGRNSVAVFTGIASVPVTWSGSDGTLLWPAEHLGDPFPDATPASRAIVLIQREYPEPVTREEIRARRQRASGCLELYGVRPISSCLSLDGRRQVCWFEGPDAESVRQMARATAEPFTRVWSALIGG